MIGRAVALLSLLAVAACGGTRSPSPAVATPSIADRDWEMVVLGLDTRPSSGRPVTLRLDSASSRAAGFAGCNRYGAGYTLRGDRLTFGPAVSTKMACPEGMEFESTFLAMLPMVTTYEVTDSNLVLRGADGPLARFRAPLAR